MENRRAELLASAEFEQLKREKRGNSERNCLPARFAYRPVGANRGTGARDCLPVRNLDDCAEGEEMETNKLEAAILYICYQFRENPANLGSVKLNKILWFSDVEYYDSEEQSITGASRIAQDHGPVVSSMIPTLDTLQEKRIIFRELFSNDYDYSQWKYTITDLNEAEKIISDLTDNEKNTGQRNRLCSKAYHMDKYNDDHK